MIDKIEIKNIKKDYVANTVILYFSDTELGNFDSIHKLIRANTKFVKIGLNNPSLSKNREYNKFEEFFISWWDNKKNEIMQAPNFFQNNINLIKKIFENADLAVLLYKSQDINMLSYIREIAYILNQYDVFSFHCVVENLVSRKSEDKLYLKLKKDTIKYSQPIISISEYSIINAYEDATLVNRKKFISRFVLDLIESIVVPFVEPELNKNHFTLIKSLFYSNNKNFINNIIPTIGFSSSKVDGIDLSIIQALSNPIFFGSFNASDTFIITIKTPYITDIMIERIKYILKLIIGENKKFIICKYIGEFDFNIYSQITILALNVDESKLISNPDNMQKHIQNLLNEISKSKKIFIDESTKTKVLDLPWNKL